MNRTRMIATRCRASVLAFSCSLSWTLACLAGAAPAAVGAPTPEDLEFFERQVRPVLAEHCLDCHGPKKQEAGLRLDSRAAVLRGSDEGPIVKERAPNESRLMEAVRRTGELKMPPDKPLAATAVAALARWVELGLPWPESPAPAAGGSSAAISAAAAKHWAFQPIRPPALPAAASDATRDWTRTSLDRFVAARRDAAGLAASPAADRRTLARRLSFDLLGLPPTPEDVAALVADEAPDAVERHVDRLMASPRLGERWARHWMDVARYADNKGYVFFEEKTYPWAYAYRDYLIESFNRDVPYDRFVTEQLAADLIDRGGDDGALRALAFLTIGAHFMNNTHDILDDRIDVVSRGLQGLTVVCARCHDHKYDPVPQADYYSLYGVFRSSEEPAVPPLFASPPDTDEYRKFTAELAVRVGKLDEFVRRKHRDLVTGARTRVAEYLLAADQARRQPATDDFMLIADTNDLNPAMIVRWRIFLEKTARQPHPTWSVWNRLATLEPGQFAAGAEQLAKQLAAAPTLDGAPLNAKVRERFAAKPPTSLGDAAKAYGELLGEVEAQWQAALKQAAEAGQPAPTALAEPQAEELRKTLYGADAPPDVPILLGWGFLSLLPDRASQGEYQKLIKEVETWLMTGPGAPPRAMVLVDSTQPHDSRVFLRGNPNRLGDAAPRQFLAVANPARRPFAQGSGRLELAREIVAPSNPLTARVYVNRVWQHLIGSAIVRTPGDFGLRSEPPTHPELLDELAARFMADGWSTKRLQRAIVTSATYAQASVERPECAKVDPENRWLWKMNSRRLGFEALRDSLLVAADSLDARLGGPSLQLLGDGLTPRRTVYGFIDRMDVPSLLTTFDFPNPSATSSQRDATIVTPQALYLMNGPFVADVAARTTGRRDLQDLPTIDDKLTRLFQVLYAREPTDDERRALTTYLGPTPTADAWTRLAHALLMTNEFLYVD